MDDLLSLGLLLCAALLNIFARHSCAENGIPVDEERLGEVGLDSNGRKNRGGTSMEKLVESFVAIFCHEHNLAYLAQANAKKIKEVIDKLLAAKFIYEIEHTNWVSPIVVVPKKNGKL